MWELNVNENVLILSRLGLLDCLFKRQRNEGHMIQQFDGLCLISDKILCGCLCKVLIRAFGRNALINIDKYYASITD